MSQLDAIQVAKLAVQRGHERAEAQWAERKTSGYSLLPSLSKESETTLAETFEQVWPFTTAFPACPTPTMADDLLRHLGHLAQRPWTDGYHFEGIYGTRQELVKTIVDLYNQATGGNLTPSQLPVPTPGIIQARCLIHRWQLHQSTFPSPIKVRTPATLAGAEQLDDHPSRLVVRFSGTDGCRPPVGVER